MVQAAGDQLPTDQETIVIHCPSCGYGKDVPETFIGRAVGCPRCQALFVVKPSATAVELPEPTAWPLVLGLGILLAAAGIATNLGFSLVGLVLFVIGLTGWIANLLPGRGHVEEPLVEAALRPRPPTPSFGTVEQLAVGKPGYRMRLPEKVQPISAGLKGGIVGGIIMPIPALLWGQFTGHGIWYPINLLTGMVLPGVDAMTDAELMVFSPSLLVVAVCIHAFFSLALGTIYGVLLPTLPRIPGGQIVWGGIVMPLLWTGASYGLMGVVNPVLQERVDWPSFIAAQFIFGVAAAFVVIRSEQIHIPPAGSGVEPEEVTAEWVTR
jgi:uncharacterized membrane protein YagU involved in acid resistance